MSSSSDIQKSIDSALNSRNSWNAELLTYNKQLVDAKKLSEKNRLKKAIKNAEDQIKDLDRSISKLTNDLRSVIKTEARSESKNILAEKGMSKGQMILDSATNLAKEVAPILTGTETNEGVLQTRKAVVEQKTEESNKKWLYIGIAALVLILFFKK